MCPDAMDKKYNKHDIVPFFIYGTRFDKKILKDVKSINIFSSKDLDILYETKGRFFDGSVIPQYFEYISVLNDLIEGDLQLLNKILQKHESKVKKYSLMHFKEMNEVKELRLEYKIFYSRIQLCRLQKCKKTIKELLKGASKQTIKRIKETFPDLDLKEYPSLKDMVKNFTTSMGKWSKEGFKFADEELIEKRLSICHSCEFWDKNSILLGGRCTKCGCATKAKISLATEKCPEQKW